MERIICKNCMSEWTLEKERLDEEFLSIDAELTQCPLCIRDDANDDANNQLLEVRSIQRKR